MASSLLMPETASSTLSSMYWLNWVSMPGISLIFASMASHSASRVCAVVHCSRGFRPTLYSVMSQPLTSVPSSGRPSWLTT